MRKKGCILIGICFLGVCIAIYGIDVSKHENADLSQMVIQKTTEGAKEQRMAEESEARKAANIRENSITKKKDTEQEKYVIREENVPGCDDPKHGTTYITYSDGSVETVDY